MATKGMKKQHVERLKELERKYTGSTGHDLTKLTSIETTLVQKVKP